MRLPPQEAKLAGRKVRLRPDWEQRKVHIMAWLVLLKFENPKLREKLLDTGTALLVEENTWHDNEWGNCTCKRCMNITGQNKLGVILMTVRAACMLYNYDE